MDKNFRQRLKNSLKGDFAKGWRSTFFIVILLIIGILFMVISSYPQNGQVTETPADNKEMTAAYSVGSDYKGRLEKELGAGLRRVRGVGEVAVLITLESGPSFEYAKSQQTTDRSTREEDSAGGKRQVDEKTIDSQPVISRSNSGDQPVIVREVKPKIAGVLIIAGGAGNPEIKAQIVHAVSTSLNVPAHRVSVLPME